MPYFAVLSIDALNNWFLLSALKALKLFQMLQIKLVSEPNVNHCLHNSSSFEWILVLLIWLFFWEWQPYLSSAEGLFLLVSHLRLDQMNDDQEVWLKHFIVLTLYQNQPRGHDKTKTIEVWVDIAIFATFGRQMFVH